MPTYFKNITLIKRINLISITIQIVQSSTHIINAGKNLNIKSVIATIVQIVIFF